MLGVEYKLFGEIIKKLSCPGIGTVLPGDIGQILPWEDQHNRPDLFLLSFGNAAFLVPDEYFIVLDDGIGEIKTQKSLRATPGAFPRYCRKCGDILSGGVSFCRTCYRENARPYKKYDRPRPFPRIDEIPELLWWPDS
mgnify:FL=1